MTTLDEVAGQADTAALERVVQRLLRSWEYQTGEDAPTAVEVMRRFGGLYLDARVAGLCHDGAVEVFEEGIREYQLAVVSVKQSCSFPRQQ